RCTAQAFAQTNFSGFPWLEEIANAAEFRVLIVSAQKTLFCVSEELGSERFDENIRRTQFPGPPDRRGRARWLGQIHPDLSAETLARSRGHPGLFQRMEFLRAGEIRDEQRKKARTPDAHHIQPDSRDRLRGSL